MSDPAAIAERRLRIMMIAPAGLGGTIQYSHNLANALGHRGHEVCLVTAIDNELSRFPRSYELLGAFDRFTPHAGPLRAFWRRIRSFDPHIVHFQGAQRPEFYLLIWAILRRRSSARFVWTPQDVLSNSLKPYHARLLRHLYGRMGHVFVNARQNLAPIREMFGVPSERITLLSIPDLLAFARSDLARACPPEMPAPIDPHLPFFLCFGLIEPRKGIGTLIEAFARMQASGPPARLLIIGKPLTATEEFAEAIARTGLPPERLQMIPRYASFEEMNALFEAAAAVVLPYHQGWNSGVLSAAQGYGRPVIATRVGGFDEVVEHGVSGLLVPPNDPGALAEALTRIAAETGLGPALAEGSRAAGARSSWTEVARATTDAYARVLQ